MNIRDKLKSLFSYMEKKNVFPILAVVCFILLLVLIYIGISYSSQQEAQRLKKINDEAIHGAPVEQVKETVNHNYERELNGIKDSIPGKQAQTEEQAKQQEQQFTPTLSDKEVDASTIYDLISKKDFEGALEKVSVIQTEDPLNAQVYKKLEADLSIISNIKTSTYPSDTVSLFPFIDDPKIMVYTFLSFDHNTQKKLIKIPESDICAKYKDITNAEIIKPDELPNFSKFYNSESILNKEIWKLEVYTDEYTPTDSKVMYYYVIKDVKDKGKNEIYYAEYDGTFKIGAPTKYTDLVK